MNTPQETLGSILLPLDGSDMAEFAVPYAAQIALALDLPVLVTRILEQSTWAAAGSGYLLAPQAYQNLLEAAERDAQAETHLVGEELRRSGVRARALVARGNPLTDLTTLEARERCAVIVMATHGRTGLARMALGSVADYVARHGSAPTLLVRAQGELSAQPSLGRALVPLDGSAFSELALKSLNLFAGRMIHHVTLLRVIDPDERAGASREAQDYLTAVRARVESEFAERKLTLDWRIAWGAAAVEIMRMAAGYDVIVMATHGKTGATRWAYGSVADEVIHGTITPLLLTRSLVSE